MYTLEIINDNNNLAVSLDALKLHLRLNTADEDGLLTGHVRTATQFFESMTGRSVLTKTYRQHVNYFNATVNLMKAPVTSITNVKYWDKDGVLQTVNTFDGDIISTPASVSLDNYPQTSTKKNPKAYVEFVAGWANAGAVPADVQQAILLLSSHFYGQRENFTEANLNALPMGFRDVCNMYKTGLIGPWGQ